MDEWTLNDLLECSVCLERLDTSSKVLPCQHTFCKKCLEEIVATHKELRCPECRVLVDVKIDELPPNVLLMRILEGMRNAAPKKRNSGGGGSLSAQHTPSRLPMSTTQPMSLPFMHFPQHQLMAGHLNESSAVIQPPCVPPLSTKAAGLLAPQPPSLASNIPSAILTSPLHMSTHQYIMQPHAMQNTQSSYIRLDQSSTLPCPTSNSDAINRHVDQMLPTTHITVLSSQNYPSGSDHPSTVTVSPTTTTIANHHHRTPPPVASSVSDSSTSSRTSSSNATPPSHNSLVSSIAGQDPSSRLPIHVPNKVTGQPCARAVYDYLSKMPGDLSFKEGDLIILRRKIDNNWYHGECRGSMGVFPLSYVEIVTPLPCHIPQCKALYDFRMSNDDEEGCLTFNKGEIITVIRRVDENWAEGKLGDRIGIFPLAFVELNSVGRALMKLSSNCQPGPSRVAPPTPTTEDVTPLIPTDHTRTVATTHTTQSSNAHHSVASDSSSSTTLTSPSSSSSSSTTPPTSSSSTAPSSPTSPPQPPTSTTSHAPHSHHKRHSFTALQHPSQSQNSHRHSAEILSTGETPGQDGSSSGPQSLQLTTSTSSSHTEVTQSCLQRSGSQRHHRSTSSEVVPPPPPPLAHQSLQLPASYVALYPYKPQKSDELELKRGNVYTVTERCQDGWFKGTNKNQKCGVFPGNYVAPASSRSLPALQAQLRGIGRTSLGSGSSRANTVSMPSPEPRSYTRPSSARHLSAGATNPPELPPRSVSPGGNACMPSSWHGDMPGINSNRTQHVPLMTSSGPAGSSSKKYIKRNNGLEIIDPFHLDPNGAVTIPSMVHSPGHNVSVVDPATAAVIQENNTGVTATSSSSPSDGKTNEKVKEKKDRSGGVGLMKRHFFSIKKSKSPPPTTYSMDNPVFEDGTGTMATVPVTTTGVAVVAPHPVHVRSNDTGSPVPGAGAHHRKSNSLDSGALVGGATNDPRKSKQLVPVVKERFRCIVPYPPNSEYELELQVGDVIYVHKKREDGWYKGTQQRTGRTGLFPASFVETF